MKWNHKYAAAAVVLVGVFALAMHLSQQNAASPQTDTAIPWKSFDDGVKSARESHKKILVDVYTDWCSWCKKMDAEVYTDPDVVKAINKEFVAVKLNAESPSSITYNGKSYTEAEFARALGVSGYPTILFFDAKADPITSLAGYSPAQRFTKVLEYIAQDQYKKISFQQFLGE